MIKNIFAVLAITILLLGCNNKNETPKENSEIPVIELAKFEETAGKYVGKQVKVIGIADHVCKHGGKRLFMVADGADLHVESDKRFNDDIMGQEVILTGKVLEFRIDEGYCLQQENDNIQNHKEGISNKDDFEIKKKQIQEYRDYMKANNTDHISYYSLEYVSHEVKK